MDRKAESTDGERNEQGLEVRSKVHSDDKAFIDEVNLLKGSQIVINDWSLTGRGSHVDFGSNEAVPLEQGRFLGRGSMGDVYETIVQGWTLAHKKILFRRKIGDKEKTEIEILKRLSHVHMLQLIGTYTQQKILGILTYPVAVCDLHTFFEDVEAWSTVEIQEHSSTARYEALESTHKARLEALDYSFPAKDAYYKALPVYSKIGCLISAVAYLHDHKIRHKDLKPSNILLSRDRLWLSDFGSATDFTMLSNSSTDNERGTPRYFAPEVADWKPNGRAADVFSLGCVLLEIVVIHDRGTLKHIRQNRSVDPSFHANLDRVETWLQPYNKVLSPRRYHLLYEIKAMLSRDPAKRPAVQDLLTKVFACDLGRASSSIPSVFSKCCQRLYIPRQEHEMHMLQLEKKFARLEIHLLADRARMQAEHDEQTSTLKKTVDQLNQHLYEARDALEGQIQVSNAISMALEREDENKQASQLQLSVEKEGGSNAEIMMRQLLAEKQKQDTRIAQLEEELKSKTTTIEAPESKKLWVRGLDGKRVRRPMIQKADPFASEGVLKPQPKNRNNNGITDFDKGKKGDEQRSRRPALYETMPSRQAYNIDESEKGSEPPRRRPALYETLPSSQAYNIDESEKGSKPPRRRPASYETVPSRQAYNIDESEKGSEPPRRRPASYKTMPTIPSSQAYNIDKSEKGYDSLGRRPALHATMPGSQAYNIDESEKGYDSLQRRPAKMPGSQAYNINESEKGYDSLGRHPALHATMPGSQAYNINESEKGYDSLQRRPAKMPGSQAYNIDESEKGYESPRQQSVIMPGSQAYNINESERGYKSLRRQSVIMPGSQAYDIDESEKGYDSLGRRPALHATMPGSQAYNIDESERGYKSLRRQSVQPRVKSLVGKARRATAYH